MRIMRAVLCSLCLLLINSTYSIAETADTYSNLYRVVDPDGVQVFTFVGSLSKGDEYISAENVLYRVIEVYEDHAIAERIGNEPMPDVLWLETGEAKAVFSDNSTVSSQDDQRRLIALYVTHSDESYVPTDGTESIYGQGGIYDVAREFRDALQAQGVDVILDESTHLPHDAGAYRRSRQTAERLLQKRPDAIIDIHRDGIPDQSEYARTIEGEQSSQVRLLVGRSNQNSEVNRAFAKEIKAVADKIHPGLIKDIFIGKGNYNQDLSPNAILLEFGTHTISKDRALHAAELMANVVSTTLYGNQTSSAKSREVTVSSSKSTQQSKDSGIRSGFIWLIILIILGVVVFALLQTGGGRAMRTKLGRNVREVTGGLIGKKTNDPRNEKDQ